MPAQTPGHVPEPTRHDAFLTRTEPRLVGPALGVENSAPRAAAVWRSPGQLSPPVRVLSGAPEQARSGGLLRLGQPRWRLGFAPTHP